METGISETRRFIVPPLRGSTLELVLLEAQVVWRAKEQPQKILDLNRVCSRSDTDIILCRLITATEGHCPETSEVLKRLKSDGYEPEDLLAQLRIARHVSFAEINRGPILALGGCWQKLARRRHFGFMMGKEHSFCLNLTVLGIMSVGLLLSGRLRLQ